MGSGNSYKEKPHKAAPHLHYHGKSLEKCLVKTLFPYENWPCCNTYNWNPIGLYIWHRFMAFQTYLNLPHQQKIKSVSGVLGVSSVPGVSGSSVCLRCLR